MAKSTKSRAGIARTEVAERIFSLFIKPILRDFIVAPNSTVNELHRKLEMWFDNDKRDIWIVKAKSPFNIVGPRWYTTGTPERLHVYGDGERRVEKGEYMYVRTDERRPDVVDVEYKEQVFAVRATDWSVLQEKCEFIR